MQQLMTKLSGKLNKTETALSSHSLIPDGLFSYLNVFPKTAFEDVPSPSIPLPDFFQLDLHVLISVSQVQSVLQA